MISFDTNILVYATASISDVNVMRARDLVARAMRTASCVLLLQAPASNAGSGNCRRPQSRWQEDGAGKRLDKIAPMLLVIIATLRPIAMASGWSVGRPPWMKPPWRSTSVQPRYGASRMMPSTLCSVAGWQSYDNLFDQSPDNPLASRRPHGMSTPRHPWPA